MALTGQTRGARKRYVFLHTLDYRQELSGGWTETPKQYHPETTTLEEVITMSVLKLLTREEMASMLAAAISLEKLQIPPAFESLGEYKDIKNVDADFLEDVRLMVNLQIMTGTDDDAFSPKGESTRAQAAVVFIRTLRALEMID